MYGSNSITDHAEAPGRPDRPQAAPVEDGPLHLVRAVLAAASRHRAPLAIWMALCIGVAALNAFLTPPSYTASATLLLDPRRSAGGFQDGLALPALDLARADSELQVIKSERLLSTVFTALNLDRVAEFAPKPPGLLGRISAALFGSSRPPAPEQTRQTSFLDFSEHISARRVGQSYVVEISGWSTDPTLARRIANATASAYLLRSLTLKADAAENGAEFVQSRVNALAAQVKAASAALAAGELPEVGIPDADARVIGAALQPLRRSGPRTGLIVSLGAIIGLATASIFLAVRLSLDRRLRTADDVVRATGLPCLASVPDTSRLPAKGATAGAEASPGEPFGKAIRDLRTAILLSAPSRRGDDNTSIAILACTPDCGSTTVASSLARLIRDEGQPTTLIDADLRGTPSLPLAPGARTAPSLAEALKGGAPAGTTEYLDLGGIAYLPARTGGRRAADRAAYLGTARLRHIIDEARERSTVLIDLPALSVAADARAAALYVDVVVLVARAGHTTQDDLSSAARLLDGVGANVIGIVLNRARS